MSRRAIDQREDDFQAAVIEYAELLGWLVYHVTNVHRRLRSHTSVGFLDLVLVRGGRLLIVELKTNDEDLDPEQVKWFDALKAVPGLVVDVWRPSDWPRIERVMRQT